MKKHWLAFFSAYVLVHFPMYSSDKSQSIEESLSLRRIIEYWKEGEFETVKVQIHSFVAEHPDSAYVDTLYAMLGDLYFKEKNYAEALRVYDLISQEPFLEKTQFKHLYCLYDQGLHSDVVEYGAAFLSNPKRSKAQEQTVRFQMADSLYRLGKATDHPSAKEELFKQAVEHFKALAQTEYAEQTLYPLATIYSSLKENARAAALFESLATKHPEQREAFLFQAATLLLDVDKDAAIEVYGKIYPMNGSLAGKAAFNQIQLLFEQKRYRDLLLAQETALKHIPLEHLNTMRYYIGKSLVNLNDYQNAVPHLVQFLEGKSQDPLMAKNAAFSLVICAKETQDMGLLDRSLNNLRSSFPKEQETAQALILHAQLCKEKQDFKRAQEDLSILIADFPEHAEREAFLYDHALLFYQGNHWKESSRAFKEFLSSYPSSSKKASAYRHLIAAQVEEAKSTSSDTLKVKKEALIETLVIALGEKNLFSADDKKQMRYLLGQSMYEIGKYQDALTELKDFVHDFPSDAEAGKAHLVIAHCLLKRDFDPHLFVEHAEKAIALDPAASKGLHLQLYNTYLELAEQSPDQEKSPLIDQAANHLFFSLDQGVKNENRLWLAHYYFQRYEQTSGDQKTGYLDRAIVVLENVLKLGEDPFDLTISPQTLEVEGEAIKLSLLYSDANRSSDAIGILSALKREYEAHPQLNWKYRRLALFELGQNYEKIGDVEEAIRTYDSLIATSTHVQSYFGIAARVQKTRLEYGLLCSNHKGAKHLNLQTIYDRLKDIEIQRKLVTEPWHLEAALTYIDVKTASAPESERTSLQLELVCRMHDNFSSLEDSSVQNYLSAAEQFPDQFALYQQYMQFLDAEELRLDGMTMRGATAEESLAEAEAIYHQLMDEPLHDLLRNRIQERLEELKAL